MSVLGRKNADLQKNTEKQEQNTNHPLAETLAFYGQEL